MISILIPTYNAVCLPLIEKVHSQAVALQIPFEILLADDASREDIRQQNRKITEWQGCRYLQKEENQGPARLSGFGGSISLSVISGLGCHAGILLFYC